MLYQKASQWAKKNDMNDNFFNDFLTPTGLQFRHRHEIEHTDLILAGLTLTAAIALGILIGNKLSS